MPTSSATGVERSKTLSVTDCSSFRGSWHVRLDPTQDNRVLILEGDLAPTGLKPVARDEQLGYPLRPARKAQCLRELFAASCQIPTVAHNFDVIAPGENKDWSIECLITLFAHSVAQARPMHTIKISDGSITSVPNANWSL
jgi:hypothetical protein